MSMAEFDRGVVHKDREVIVKHVLYTDGSTNTVAIGELVRCKDCKHRLVNEHYGEKGYINLKAMCDLDTGDIFELGRNAEIDDWYCADAERKEGKVD